MTAGDQGPLRPPGEWASDAARSGADQGGAGRDRAPDRWNAWAEVDAILARRAPIGRMHDRPGSAQPVDGPTEPGPR